MTVDEVLVLPVKPPPAVDAPVDPPREDIDTDTNVTAEREAEAPAQDAQNTPTPNENSNGATVDVDVDASTDAPPPAETEASATPRSEKRKSQLPLPGSRLPLRKGSNNSLTGETSPTSPVYSPTITASSTAASGNVTPLKLKRMSLPLPTQTPKLQVQSSALRRPSPGRSPNRTPASPSTNGSGDGEVKSPATPSRIGFPRLPSVSGGQRSLSSSQASNSTASTPRALQRPCGGTPRKTSGLPTIAKTPSRETMRSGSGSSASTPSTSKTVPTTRRTPVSATPRAPVSRKQVSGGSEDPPPRPLATRTPLRVRSFQGKPTATSSPAATVTQRACSVNVAVVAAAAVTTTTTTTTTSTPKATTVTSPPKSVQKPGLRPPAAKPRAKPAPPPEPVEEAEPLDKRQRAMASSQALRDQIKKARAARRSSNATQPQAQTPSEWPEVVIAGVDDKKDGEDEAEDGSDADSDPEHPFGPEAPPKALPIRPGGILDLTSKNLEALTTEQVGETPCGNVKVLLLQRNSLRAFPEALPLFTGLYTLDVSVNSIRGTEYLPSLLSAVEADGTGKLHFPWLKTLLAHSNMMTSIQPLVDAIDAPRLNYFDVHGNRLTSYPKALTKMFPALTTFVASDNRIEEVEVDGLEGLQVLDLMNNCIGRLPPRLGLLEGLRELRVVGNAFRVPRRQVLERSTAEVLEWLRDRIPVEERSGGRVEEIPEGEDGWDMVGREEVRAEVRAGGSMM
ncbi:hypothetical protein Dda_2157 [Drechslerella dactyloides]|uniref:Uncharacterized protein n=1 Tax=Drechslerella dactyloides TaxID=74499 RepID=A0AAD6NM27_DREDA|nr:hypothetical protein Dda_2157 [Drechslerella dactyloides]